MTNVKLNPFNGHSSPIFIVSAREGSVLNIGCGAGSTSGGRLHTVRTHHNRSTLFDPTTIGILHARADVPTSAQTRLRRLVVAPAGRFAGNELLGLRHHIVATKPTVVF
jgi:hypothetical protein